MSPSPCIILIRNWSNVLKLVTKEVLSKLLFGLQLQATCWYHAQCMLPGAYHQHHVHATILSTVFPSHESLCIFFPARYEEDRRVSNHRLVTINPLKPELNPICYLLALLGAHHFLHVSRIRVKLLTFRLLMSYTYGAPILDVSRSHTTTQHSR